MISRKLTVALVAAAIGVASSALVAAPASATESGIACTGSNTWTFKVNGAGIYLRETDKSTRLGRGYAGQRFCVDTRGANYVHGTNNSTGVTGWVYVNYLSI